MVLAIKNYILPDNTQAWTSVYVFQPHFICPYTSPTSSPPQKLQSVALKATLIRIKQMACYSNPRLYIYLLYDANQQYSTMLM